MADEGRALLLRAIRGDSIDNADYELLDTPEPKVFKEIFPFNEPPKMNWDGIDIPIEIPDKLWITDTSFRDGQQSRDPYTVDQIVELYKYLNKIGGPQGKILMTECFLYTKRDREAVDRIRNGEIRLPGIEAKPAPEEAISRPKPNIFALYEENIGLLTPIIAEELKEAEKLYPEQWLADAFKEAVNANRRSWRFVAFLLERWATEGKKDGTYRRNLKATDPDKYVKDRYGEHFQR